MHNPGVRVAVAILVASALTSCARTAVPASAPAPAPASVAPVEITDEDLRAPWETEKDPVRARTLKLEEEWRLHPAFTDVPLRFHDLRPALVAEEPVGHGEIVGNVAKMAGTALQGLEPRFRAFLRDAGIDAPPLADIGDVRIRLAYLRSRMSFDSWHRRNGLVNPGAAYYSPRDGWIIAHGDEASPVDVLQLGTYALLREYRRHFCRLEDDAVARREGAPSVPVERDDPRLRTSLAWFDRGLARYFARLRPTPGADGEWENGPPDVVGRQVLLESWKTGRALPLREYLFLDSARVQARAKFRGGGQPGEPMEELVALQGEWLVRYFLDADEEKVRIGFRALVKSELEGKSSAAYFLDAFGLPRRRDDPAVAAWIEATEEACRRYVEAAK